MFFQVLPPSTLLYTPSPYDTELRGLFSPVPTQTMFGSDGATATSPMEQVVSLSNWFSNVVPLLTVFSSPPPPRPIQYIIGSASFTAIAVTRPPMFAGPMQRHANGLSNSSGIVPSGTPGTALATVTGAVLRASSLPCSSRSCFCSASSCFCLSASVSTGGALSCERAAPAGTATRAANNPARITQRNCGRKRITVRTLGKGGETGEIGADGPAPSI